MSSHGAWEKNRRSGKGKGDEAHKFRLSRACGPSPMEIGAQTTGPIQPQWIQGGPNGPRGGISRPEKCPLRGDKNRAKDCPRRHQGRHQHQHAWFPMGFVAMLSEKDQGNHDMVLFSYETCRGKLIVDSGATKTVAGLQVFEDWHDFYHQNVYVGSILSDQEARVRCLPARIKDCW